MFNTIKVVSHFETKTSNIQDNFKKILFHA